MREMIFNEASVAIPGNSIHAVAPMVADLARGMAALLNAKRVSPALRMSCQLHEIMCAEDGSLFDALQMLRLRGTDHDASIFFQSLSQKIPLTTGLPAELFDRFLGCEGISPSGLIGEPLVLCAQTAGIAISIPLQPAWDTDQITVRFLELIEDGSVLEIAEHVDNVARACHAPLIIDRDRAGAFDRLSVANFWKMRNDVFPRLKFGLAVESQITRINPGLFQTVMGRINELHSSALDWDGVDAPSPSWQCKVTPESANTMRNPALREARCFPDSTGLTKLYEWHARFGSAGRIHLRFDARNKEIEIGYIGGHLPL